MTSTIDHVDQDQLMQVQRDEFASEEYLDPNARLPRIQALRGEDPKQCGYFIEINQAAKAGWNNFDKKDLIEYVFASGETEQGLSFKKMRMLVCPRTPVLALNKTATKEQQTNVFDGYYKKNIHKANKDFTNFQAFDVFLLDAKNIPLHQIPLSLKLTGAAQYTFSLEWEKFITAITSCHAIENQIPASEKAMTFKSLCVFAFEVKREMAGDETKSPACKVAGFENPTLETWKNYFIGYNARAKEFTWQGLQPKRPLIQPDQIMAALPPVSDLEALAAAGIDF